MLVGLALSVGLLTSSVVAVAAQSQPEPVLWRV